MTAPNLITYDDFKDRVPGLTLRTIRREMTLGRWPKAVRLSPATPLLWDAAAVEAHLSALLAGLDVAQ